MEKKEISILAYIPVLHEGYRRFFEKHKDAKKLFLLGTDVTQTFRQLAKDIRALPPELIADSIRAWKIFDSVEIVDAKALEGFAGRKPTLIMPDEDIMHELQEKYFPKAGVSFDSIFLRWDKHKSFENKPVEADQKISGEEFDKKIITLLRKEADKSPDFWRQIGAAVFRDGKAILTAYNAAVPDQYMPYIEGDPRSDFHKGVNVELSTSFHAEARLIAEAAQKGICLEGVEMYATTFPCPPCAKLIAYSGVKKLYYADGYGVLDGERILKDRGVEIIFVETKPAN